jgi:transposase
LRALDVSVDCLYARYVAAAISLQVNKTGANDAHCIAQVVRSGWYRPAVVRSLHSCRVRAKAGDRPARSLLFEAANALMTRVRHENSLRAWGLKLSAKIGSH